VKGSDLPDTSNLATSVQTLSRNADKSYGVCLALNNVFYTQPQTTVYGVKKTGGPVTSVTNRLVNPRGCAWDGDGTVYVADRGANAVFSFPGNMPELSMVEVSKAVDFDDAFGVAVYSGTEFAAVPSYRGILVLIGLLVANLL